MRGLSVADGVLAIGERRAGRCGCREFAVTDGERLCVESLARYEEATAR